MQAWYLIYCKPRGERLAEQNLERQGYSSYLPLIRNRRRRAGRVVSVVEAMFPRYLFVHLDDVHDNWAPIRSTLGVANLVRFGTDAARVPEDLIAALRAREDEQGVQVIAPASFRRGERVRIATGPFAEYEAIFEARSSRERVIVLLEVAGKLARVQVRDADLEALAGSPVAARV